jgi:hypothetical protein
MTPLYVMLEGCEQGRVFCFCVAEVVAVVVARTVIQVLRLR